MLRFFFSSYFRFKRYHTSNLSLFCLIRVSLIDAPLHSLPQTSPVVQNMETNGGSADVARVLSEIETLKAAKSDIENRLSALEAQLRETNVTQPRNYTVSNGSCRPISAVDSGLLPDMIYRYSRHLLLPSFGVQGLTF